MARRPLADGDLGSTCHERTAAWPRAEGEDKLRNALGRGQASVLLFMALK